MIKPIQLAHVLFKTRRFNEMILWYQTVLNADVRFQNDFMAFVSYDEEHHRIALLNQDAVDPDKNESINSGAGTFEHLSFTYASASDLLQHYARLKELNITPHMCIHHGMTLSMYYGDPDGNHVECQVDVYKTAEDANRFMEDDAFTKNSLGVNYNPDDLLEKLNQGASEEVLLTYTEGPLPSLTTSPNRNK